MNEAPSFTTRSFFGKVYYKADEVDSFLAHQRQENKRLSSEVEALHQEWDTDPVDSDLPQQLEDLQQQLTDVQNENDNLQNKLTSQEAVLADERRRFAEEKKLLEAKYARGEAYTQCLNQTIEDLKIEIQNYEKFTSDSVVAKANDRANQMVVKAQQESEQILAEATKQRDNVVAASRAAYYNALQFKMNIASCMNDMEHDLDQAIDALRLLHYPVDDVALTIQNDEDASDKK